MSIMLPSMVNGGARKINRENPPSASPLPQRLHFLFQRRHALVQVAQFVAQMLHLLRLLHQAIELGGGFAHGITDIRLVVNNQQGVFLGSHTWDPSLALNPNPNPNLNRNPLPLELSKRKRRRS